MNDLRVIIVAENASRKMGGEAILPYHYFRILRSRGIDAWLVVHERTRSELQSLFPQELSRLYFVRDKFLQKLFFRLGRFLPRRVAESTLGLANQIMTQWSQRALVRSLITPEAVVHQPTPVSPRSPSLLWDVGAPVVIGPMNGGMEYPPAFRKSESAASRVFLSMAQALSDTVNALLPGKRRASVVLVANQRTQAALPLKLKGRVEQVAENGVDLSLWPASLHNQQDAPTRFLFMGRLVDWKALDIVIEALAQVPDATLDIIGDGPCLKIWQQLTMKLDLLDRIHFHGWVPQDECSRYLAAARALVLPSLFECGGAVVLEAMAMGKPVIATNWGGPAEYLDSSCGILIEPISKEHLIEGFATAMRQLSTSPEFAQQLGSMGRARVVALYDWEKKVDTMLSLYHSALPAAATEA